MGQEGGGAEYFQQALIGPFIPSSLQNGPWIYRRDMIGCTGPAKAEAVGVGAGRAPLCDLQGKVKLSQSGPSGATRVESGAEGYGAG